MADDPFIKSIAKIAYAEDSSRAIVTFTTDNGVVTYQFSIFDLQTIVGAMSQMVPICSKSNTIQGLPFRNSRLGRGRRNGRTSRRQKQADSFGETAKRNRLRIRPRTVGSKPAARRYRKGCEDIAGSAIARPSLISNAPAAVAVWTAIRNRKRRGRSPHSGSIPRKLSVLIDADKREHRNRRPSRCSLP
jgi:hypothetical protein